MVGIIVPKPKGFKDFGGQEYVNQSLIKNMFL